LPGISSLPGAATVRSVGELEIMTISNEHERIKKWIGDLMAVYFEEAGIEIVPRGSSDNSQSAQASWR
jgi:hypothetical protein